MEMRIYRADDELTHLALSGRMDTAGVLALERGFQALMQGGRVPVLLDLSEVTLMVSIGMRMLIEAGKALAEHKAELILIGPQGIVSETLRIAKMDTIFRIVPTMEEAKQLLEHG